MTAVLEHETLAQMDAKTRERLEQAAQTYRDAPANLKAEILASGEKGDRPADIVKAIGHVYTYDYVARLVRDDRERRKKSGSEQPASSPADS